MADKKISQLTSATTPLAGTETLPIVQGGVTVKVTVSDLTAGRNVATADLTTTGNTILGNAQTDTLNVGNGDLVKDASGNFGLGTASPIAKLDISGSAQIYNNTFAANTVSAALYLGNRGGLAVGLSSAAGIFAVSGTGNWYSGTSLAFNVNAGPDASSNSSYEAMRLKALGDLTLNVGNLVIGTAGKGISLPGGITWTSGSGSPEGVVTAPVGSLYSRSICGAGTSLSVKESGIGNTGWAGK